MKLPCPPGKYILRKLPVLLIVVIYLVTCMLTTGCPIKFFTGISCPGCGMTRAYAALLKGDLTAAFGFHPLWPTAPFLFLYMMTEGLYSRRLSGILTISFTSMYFITYIIRLIFFRNDIIGIDLYNSFVVQLIIKIFGGL